MTARVLVIKRGDLGDLLLATPALRALRDALPRARIDLLAPRLARRVVAGSALVDRHIPLHPSALPVIAARYDVCVLLEHLTTRVGSAKYAALALATGARRRIGLDNGRGWFLTDRVTDPGFGAVPEPEYWLKVVARLGADPSPRQTELTIADEDRRAADELLAGLNRPIVALHPGGGSYTGARRWAPDRFAAVGRRLTEERDASLVVVGNEAELNARVAAACGARDFSGSTSLPVLAALLGRVDLLVTNDSGVAHVGAAANARMVVLYGQTDPRAWRPYYGGPGLSRAEVVQVPLPCRPCLYREHELGWRAGCATRDCLELVSVGMVEAAVERQLAIAEGS